jgi:hypothetical protein
MTRIALLGAGCCVLALATGCESREAYRAKRAEREAVRTISKLDCPEAQGDLKRLSVAPDGKSCSYGGPEVEVTLQLVSFTGQPSDALGPIEADLKAIMPDAPGPAPKSSDAPAESAPTNKESVRMPGLTVETEEGQEVERATVRMPGVKIETDGENAKVEVAGVKIEARESQNEVRITRERWSEDEKGQLVVNAKDGDVTVDGGEHGLRIGGPKKQGFRSTFIKSTDSPASPYAVVAYEARGPKAGPLVVAVLKSKARSGGRHPEGLLRDAGALVKHNVGG